MLGDISGVREIYIVTGYTDMRKSIDGLCAIIEEQFSMNVTSSCLYLFCGKKCDRIKALIREPDGITLLYKRLSVSHGRYCWPRNKSEVRNLTWQEFDWLMSGLDIERLPGTDLSDEAFGKYLPWNPKVKADLEEWSKKLLED